MKYYGCSDNSCVFGNPNKQGTNGGCRCIPYTKPTAEERTRLRNGILELRKEIARLNEELLYAGDEMTSMLEQFYEREE